MAIQTKLSLLYMENFKLASASWLLLFFWRGGWSGAYPINRALLVYCTSTK
jgi:hypothetical protein